jgi:hypothetical protein
MFCAEQNISKLWDLESLGIKDPISKLSEKEEETEAIVTFCETTRRNEEGRYIVHLPWKAKPVDFPNGLFIARRRLESTTMKLRSKNLFSQYNEIFLDWLKEGFIEEVIEDERAS